MATLAASGNWLFNDDRAPLQLKLAAAVIRVGAEVLADAQASAGAKELARKVLANPLAVRDGLEPWRGALANDDTVVGVGAPQLTDDVILAAVRRAFVVLAA